MKVISDKDILIVESYFWVPGLKFTLVFDDVGMRINSHLSFFSTIQNVCFTTKSSECNYL